MGARQSKNAQPIDPNQTQSNDVDAQLLRERLGDLFKFKILLLGAGESGKSTIVKQLKIIHNKKTTKQEAKTYGDSLHQNVLDCVRSLIQACEAFNYQMDGENQELAKIVMSYPDGNRISYEDGVKIKKLFNSEAIQKAYARKSEFWLLDGCQYYIDNIDRFTEIGYEPTEEDMMMARVRTTGIIETTLEEKRVAPGPDEPDTITFQVVDVGGQRNERKKWIHCFDDVKAILFIENLAGYNRVLFEDATKNMMKESLELFEQTVRNPVFKNTPIFLFLNKKDLFERMIRQHGLNTTFPEYDGPNDVISSLDYITKMFRDKAPPEKHIDVQYVTGLWKRDVRCAFEEVKKKLLEINARVIEVERKYIQKEKTKIENPKQGVCTC